MTDPANTASAAAPGWYPDASGAQRWWDGRGWTDHVAAPATPTGYAQAQPLVRPALPEGTRVDTVWVWLVATVSLLASSAVFLFDFSGYMRVVIGLSYGLGGTEALTRFFAVYFLIMGLSVLAYALTVIAAYRDYRHLTAVGVVRPFHWAFAFIPMPLVYLIGRLVVLRKVIRTAGWPLWVHVALYAALLIGSIVWSVALTMQMLNEFPGYFGVYSSS
ncbi:DUF2510 domain-containing protein [Protaetiibacter intestinalis]|uniref:DUF2510 domain-containing protein n=1 Tax=Protaetiibacter intestinalis TaxID=2419774 RepID=A0A387BB19_9MICO|nr:DUF2510 domain-containing protein [Protaetiibacter intestinalis]AYF98139.1 DUF2510 domain-containing protein [Protaetiibacter intestinalis]